MNTYGNDYGDNRFQSLLADYKPRVWKQETPLDPSVYSKPEPTSKTRIPSRATFSKESIKPSLQPYF